MKILSNIYNFLFDILFPKHCLSCAKEGFYVCPACFAKIPVQKSIHCYICAKRAPDGQTCPECKTKNRSNLTGLLIASDWNNLLIRQMIYEFKYRFVRDLAKPLGDLLVIFLNQSGFFLQHQGLGIDSFLLAPVPLHLNRLNWRGFNQAELLANQISSHLKIPVANNLIFRHRHTPPQMDIKDKLERIKNISNAFELNQNPRQCEHVRGKIVILIDDVSTTGSTLEECALAIKPLKPKEIWGLVIARG